MTIVVSSNGSDRLIPGAVVVGVRGLGVKGSTIPSSGTDGPSPVYPSLSLPADANKEYRVKVITPPSPGTISINDDTSLVVNGLTAGSNSFVLKLYQDGADIGNITNSINVSAADVPVSVTGVETGAGEVGTISVDVGATPVIATLTGVESGASEAGTLQVDVGAPQVVVIVDNVESGASEVGTIDAIVGPSAPVAITIIGVETPSAEIGVVVAYVGPAEIIETPGQKMRIVYDNAIDRTATLVASTTAGSLLASNLVNNDYKTEVWRSTNTSATLTATWGSTESISMFALPFSNLSSAATIRVQGYTNTGDSVAAYDTGNTLCCEAALGFTGAWATAGANSFAYGGGVYAAIWFATMSVQKIVVTILDPSNASGYIEAARIVTGKYWSPDRNVEWESPKMAVQEDTKQERSDAGTLWTDRGPMYKKLTFDLNVMTGNDRNNMWRILRGNGMSRPVYVCVWPENDPFDAQIYSIYGKLSNNSALQYRLIDMHATSLTIEEI